ncbi:MAG: hypothetical protein ACOCUU_03890 [Nanoarchaeota archaeon]
MKEKNLPEFIEKEISQDYIDKKSLEYLARVTGEHSDSINPSKNPLYFVDTVLKFLGNSRKGRSDISEIFSEIYGTNKIKSRTMRKRYKGREYDIPLRSLNADSYYEILKSNIFKEIYQKWFSQEESSSKTN